MRSEAWASIAAAARLGIGAELRLRLHEPRDGEQKQLFSTRFERAYLEDVLRVHDGNVSAAARAAGLDRAYFYGLLWRHGLR